MALNVLIAITLSVATIYFYVNRKSRSKSIEQFQRVCGKFNYDKQSLEQKVSLLQRANISHRLICFDNRLHRAK